MADPCRPLLRGRSNKNTIAFLKYQGAVVSAKYENNGISACKNNFDFSMLFSDFHFLVYWK